MLVGREREICLIERLLDQARGGASAVLAVVGEVGIGKSALLDRSVEAATGMNVLRARGIQSEAHIPFAGLFELVRPALGCLDRVALPQRHALEGALALRPPSPQDRFAVGAATLSLLAAYSDEAPLLVTVDDAQWIDGSSADALLFAFRRLVADPIAVLLAVRDGEPSLVDGTDLAIHRLTGLDRAATARLVARRAGGAVPEELVDRLHRGTGGNPLALIELGDDAATIGPGAAPLPAPLAVVTSIGRVYLDRCATLSDAARDVLVLAAASEAGELPVLARAAAVAGLDIAELAASEAIGFVTVDADHVEFRHPLVRSAVYAAAPAERRRGLHRALAAALPDTQADRRAWHLALAALGPDDGASAALEQAGDRARTRSAYNVASQAFERAGSLAVDDSRRATLLLAAADSAWLGGLAARARELLDEAHRYAPPPHVLVRIEQLRGHLATRMGPVDAGMRILLEGAELARDIDADRAVIMLAEAVNAAFYTGDATAMAGAAARIASLIGPDSSRRARFFGAIAQGMALIFCGSGDARGAALVREATALVDTDREGLADDPRLLAWAAMGPIWLREAAPERAIADRALEVAREHAAIGVLPFLLSHIAVDRMASDRWVEAEAGFHEAIDLARETGQRTDLAFALARLAWLEARRGRETACRSHIAEARALSTQLGLGLTEIWSFATEAELELGLGHLDRALALCESQEAALAEHGVGDVDLSPAPELVDLHLRLGHPDEAAACAESFARHASAKGQPWALARAARCRGLVGPEDELDRHFGEALARHHDTPDAFEEARTRLAYGARLRRARRRVRAREELREAVAVFDALGAQPWSDAARAELLATGETARRRDPSTRDQLTPQELQIAVLLSSGRTTREAAAALFLSPKTIEYHLRSVYRKLGIGSRQELAAHFA